MIEPVKEDRKNAEKLKKWLDDDPTRSPYILVIKTRLIDECISKFGRKKSENNGYKNTDLIHMLATY